MFYIIRFTLTNLIGVWMEYFMGIFRKVLCFVFSIAILSAGFASYAAEADSKPVKKTKAALKLNRADLKKNVINRPNGDIMLRPMPDSVKYLPNFPRNLDLFFNYYFPWIDIDKVFEKYSELPDKTVDGIFVAINSVMAKTGSRFSKLNMTESNIKSRIQAGVHLFWCGADIDNFYQYISSRTNDRHSSSNIQEWKKLLPKKIFKSPTNEIFSGYYTKEYFIVVGINPESSEVAILAANNMEIVQWIAFSEMKRYNLGLYEPVW